MQRLGPAVQLLGFGSYIAVCIAGGTVAGHFLDLYFDTGRVLTIAGLALGLVAAFYGGYRMIVDTLADMERWQKSSKKNSR